MSQGFLSGVAMGAILSGLGLAGLSLVAPMPNASSLDRSDQSVASSELSQSAAVTGDPTSEDLATDEPSKMDVAQTAGASGTAPQEAQSDVAQNAPETANADPEYMQPPAEDAPAAMAEDESQDQSEAPQIAASVPKTPTGQAADSAAVDIPAGPAAQVDEDAPEIASPADQAEDSPDLMMANDGSEDAAPVVPKSNDSANVPGEVTGENNDTLADVAALDTDPPAPAMSPDAVSEPETETVPMAEGSTEGEAAPEVKTAQLEGDQTEVAGGGLSATPSTPIGNLASNVTTGRLPSIGSAAESDVGNDAEAVAQTPTSLLAIERNAIPFARAGDRPVMAILLQDEGGDRKGLGDLSSLPFPVTVVVEAMAPDVDEAIAFYKSAGAEVVVEASLPANSTPTDAEVNFQMQKEVLDRGTAVMLREDSGFQDSAELATQVSEILAAGGLGVVSTPKGLSTGHRLAIKAGVPAGLIFRDVDGAGQDGRAIRRFLDNAAFKARQQDGVIVLGRARPSTMQALIEWSLGNRAKSVALAPVSAVLLGE